MKVVHYKGALVRDLVVDERHLVGLRATILSIASIISLGDRNTSPVFVVSRLYQVLAWRILALITVRRCHLKRFLQVPLG